MRLFDFPPTFNPPVEEPEPWADFDPDEEYDPDDAPAFIPSAIDSDALPF